MCFVNKIANVGKEEIDFHRLKSELVINPTEIYALLAKHCFGRL